MGLPQKPVTLTPEQIAELNEKLAKARHDINNQLALVVASVDLMRLKPDMAPRLTETIGQQPEKILAQVRGFSREFEAALGITPEE